MGGGVGSLPLSWWLGMLPLKNYRLSPILSRLKEATNRTFGFPGVRRLGPEAATPHRNPPSPPHRVLYTQRPAFVHRPPRCPDGRRHSRRRRDLTEVLWVPRPPRPAFLRPEAAGRALEAGAIRAERSEHPREGVFPFRRLFPPVAGPGGRLRAGKGVPVWVRRLRPQKQ